MEHNDERENGDGSAPSSYSRDIKEARRSMREALRADLSAAHWGLGVTVVALIVVASSAGLGWTLIVAASFTAWFVLALAVIHLGGGRGGDAVRRAYIATFGWGNWI
ncbi:hypothetical protein OG365_20735 [Streptomyces sp. NBC_00853]|uniref:hypothetical protein n=1 Tax=Streptomyces sp. NBC_00853 TaxID=2903681 RepID=UPI003873139B|nr:hypothetical protein OG365_20735 [Streptomyces sp. NBC_00853]